MEGFKMRDKMPKIDDWNNNRIWSDNNSLHFLYNGQGELEIKNVPNVDRIAKYMDYFITYYDKENKLSKMYIDCAEHIRTLRPNAEIFKAKRLSTIIKVVSINLNDLIIDQFEANDQTVDPVKKDILHTIIRLQFISPLIKLYVDTIDEELIVGCVDTDDLKLYGVNTSRYGPAVLKIIQKCTTNSIEEIFKRIILL
jgi:hypothetical protein